MIVSIDGPIGVGKTTILQELEKRGHHVIYEDLDTWKEYLERFYENREKYALALQIKIALTHKHTIQQYKDEEGIVFIERGPFSVNTIFGKLLMEEGSLEDIEYSLVEDINDCSIVDKHILLDVSFETTKERITSRNVFNEHNNFDYISKVYQKYYQFELQENQFRLHTEGMSVSDIVDIILNTLSL